MNEKENEENTKEKHQKKSNLESVIKPKQDSTLLGLTEHTSIYLFIIGVVFFLDLFIDLLVTSVYRTLFNKTRQYNIHISDKSIFFKHGIRQTKATETNK